MILIWTLDRAECGAIVAGVERLIDQRPTQEQWRDLVAALQPAPSVQGLYRAAIDARSGTLAGREP